MMDIGLPFDSRKISRMYSPTTPSAISWTEPRHRVAAMTLAQPRGAVWLASASTSTQTITPAGGARGRDPQVGRDP